MAKETRDGYIKISTVKDILYQLKSNPQIDTIKYSQFRFENSSPTAYYQIALWSSTEQRGYGGVTFSRKSFESLRGELESRYTFLDIDSPVF